MLVVLLKLRLAFTLDAMPGKQMAIDADLNTGLIDEDEAKKRQKRRCEGSRLLWSDGWCFEVHSRGDAIAGILITIVNIIGGILIGVVQAGDAVYRCFTDLYRTHDR